MFRKIVWGFVLCAAQIGALAEVAPDAFVLQLSTEVIDAVKSDKAIQAGDVARIRHQGIQRDMEAWRQFDLGQILFDAIRLLAGLRDFGPVGRTARWMHRAQRFECTRGWSRLRSGRPGGRRQHLATRAP